MRIAFIGPKWNEMVNAYPSLGLGYLAAVAEQDGHECHIFDFGLRPNRPLEEEVADVVDYKPDLVAFTSMTTSYASVEITAEMVKDQLGVPTVIGGPHATSLPYDTLENPHLDFLIFGEGEEVFRDFLQALENRADNWGSIKGLWYKEDGRIMSGGERALIKDLDALPYPARHLFDLGQYPLYAPNGEPMITVLSSRGCPYNCSFCFKGIVGRTYRQRSPENIADELQHIIDAYGVRNFYFIDDLFTIDVRRLDKILDHFIERKMDIRWRCLARVDRVTPDLLQKMYKAGCRQIHYGIESGNEEVLKRTAKHIRLSQVRDAVRWTEEAGIHSKGYFILGLPGDTEETMEETIEFAASLDLSEAMFSIATPMPGTQLWNELIRKHPETRYNADFTRSYYYNSYTSEIAPFMNVSEVSDEVLSQMAIKARQRFLEAKKRRLYRKSFGETAGDLLWTAAQVKPIRKVGSALTRLGLFDNFRRTKDAFFGAASWG
ncbi:MAG: B12-binding domain-containing radical SAM protein [Chloroflexi bacterium]|nr:B12-binding domain-containing radical SAM protein [Chloroflexota bacterium]